MLSSERYLISPGSTLRSVQCPPGWTVLFKTAPDLFPLPVVTPLLDQMYLEHLCLLCFCNSAKIAMTTEHSETAVATDGAKLYFCTWIWRGTGSWQQNVVLQLVESAITEVRSLFIYLCVLIWCTKMPLSALTVIKFPVLLGTPPIGLLCEWCQRRYWQGARKNRSVPAHKMNICVMLKE